MRSRTSPARSQTEKNPGLPLPKAGVAVGDDPVGAQLQLVHEWLHVLPQDHRGDFQPRGLGKIGRLGEHLQGDLAELPGPLLGDDEDLSHCTPPCPA